MCRVVSESPLKLDDYELSSGFKDSCLAIVKSYPQRFAISKRSFTFPCKNAKAPTLLSGTEGNYGSKVAPKLYNDIFLLDYLPPQ